MGLPMWRAPSPEAKDALKADLTASARSPIRRRRPTRSPRSPNPASLEIPHPPSTSRPRAVPPPPVPESRNYLRANRLDAAGATAEYYRFGSTHYRPAEYRPHGGSLPPLTANFAPAAASRIRRDSPSENASRPAYPLGLDHRDRASYRRRGDLPRRESPFDRVDANYLRERTSQRGLFREERMRERQREERRREEQQREEQQREEQQRELRQREDGDSDNAVGFPPLRRMGRRNIADGPLPSSSLRETWSPGSVFDGLGDRERSLSPVEDGWASFGDVVPDPVPPTADSSFTSAAASASFSNSHPSSRAGSSNSASSSRTHLTVPSQEESIVDQFLRICDTSDDSASDTEAENDPSSAPIHSIYRTGIRTNVMRNPYRYSRGIREQVRESAAGVRSFYGEVLARESTNERDQSEEHSEDRPTSEEEIDQELRDARTLLEQLARRDDIGDEFWASVGLRRSLADRVERIQQRERL